MMPRSPAPSLPMTLGNMRANGVRSLSVSCWLCHHDAVLAVDAWSDDGCRRAAELDGAAGTAEPDRDAVERGVHLGHIVR
jgi:hypothetical protein